MGQAVDFSVAELARTQAGCIKRQQVQDLGCSDRMIERRLANGLWVRRHPGVYVLASAPEAWIQDVWAAVLAVGERAVVSHETALLVAEAADHTQLPRRPIVLTVPHGRHHRVEGAVVHQIDDVRDHHVRSVNGLDVTNPERAVVDIAATASERQLRRLIDGLVVGRQVTTDRIATVLYELARLGKRGVSRLGRVLDSLGDGYVPPHSELERMLLAALEGGGLPPPRRQLSLPGRGAVTGLVDAGYDDAKLLLEADGRRWHTRESNFAKDRARDQEAARVGWQTLRFTYEQLRAEPDEVASIVADVCRERLTISDSRRPAA